MKNAIDRLKDAARRFWKRFWCEHRDVRDFSLPIVDRSFFFPGDPNPYIETLTPVKCVKCGRKAVDSSI